MAQALSLDHLRSLFPEIDQIADPDLKTGVYEIWREIAAEMAWSDLREVPKNAKAEAGRTLVDHVAGVTRMALAICEVAQQVHGKPFDRDMLLAACLLHDVSKPVEYEPVPDAPVGTFPRQGRSSELGRKVQHAVYAAHKIFEKGLAVELAHLVVTHTHASNRRGTSWEASALFYADFADSDAALHTANATMFSQRWTLPK